MTLAPLLLMTGLMAPHWSMLDLPYPEVTGTEVAAPIDTRIEAAVADYARKTNGRARSPELDISDLIVDKATARLRLKFGDRVETLVLVRVKSEWRVVQAMPHGLH